jgi:hypothetical protein
VATAAADVTRWIAKRWEALYPSAVLSGIVGDPAHRKSGGYHISVVDNPKNNYSVVRPDDKSPPGAWPRDLAAAIDMSMSPADMRLCTARLKRVYDNPDDPRRKYLNAFNGWSGTGDARRYDLWARVTSYATVDHKWHVHAELRRRWANSWDAARATVSALAGESVAEYLKAAKPPAPKPAPTPAPKPAPAKGDEVSWTEDVIPVAGDPTNPTWQPRNALGYVTTTVRAMTPQVAAITATTTKMLAELAALRAGQVTLVNAINKLAGGQQLNSDEVLAEMRAGAYAAVMEVAGEAIADSLQVAADALDPPAKAG